MASNHTRTAAETTSVLRAAFVRGAYLRLSCFVLALLVSVTALVWLLRPGDLLWRYPLPLAALALLLGGAWLARRCALEEPARWVSVLAGLHVLVQAVALVPLVCLLAFLGDGILLANAIATLALAAGLLFAAVISRSEYSPAVSVVCLVVPVACTVGILGAILGVAAALVSGSIVGLAALWIVSDTTRALRYHRVDRSAAAALALSGWMLVMTSYLGRLALCWVALD